MIFSFFLLILFCLLLHPKENCGCLILYALLAFISLAPNFLGASSTVVLATSLFMLGLLVCAVNIVEVKNGQMKLIADDGRIIPILFGYHAVYAERGMFDNLNPTRDNAFFYSMGKTLTGIQIDTVYE